MRNFHTGKRILIVGAESTAEQLARTLLATPSFNLLGFLDNNHTKRNTTIHGIPVLGSTSDLPLVFKKHSIDEVIITDPNFTRETIRIAQENEIDLARLKVLPTLADLMEGKITLTNLRDISIEDLLGRKSVKIDTRLMREFLQNKKVLVTGAAGSIGSELVSQILGFQPSLLAAVDQNETALFYLDRRIHKEKPNASYRSYIADVCDVNRVRAIFNEVKPDVIFHAAAYKHVSVMEANPLEAIKNNIFGTLTIGTIAQETGVSKVIFISTDKAVRPVSIMGRTKHVGEKICVFLHKKGATKFCAVRFGNVLDSQGNVIELFKEQIKKGGPVEITHPDMQRYFMVTSEACLLLMQAGALSENGEIFCLDMGKPVRVVDLASEMIRLAGYKPHTDISIAYTKPRPGERLYEELLIEGEIPTQHDKIFIARLHGAESDQELDSKLEELKQAVIEMSEDRAKFLLLELAPTHRLDKNLVIQ